MKNLLQRALSGSIFVLIILSAIVAGPYSFAIAFGAIVVLCLYEFYQLVNKANQVSVRLAINCMGGLYLFFVGYFHSSLNIPFIILILPYILYLMSILVAGLYLKKENPVHNWAYAFLGQVYIVIPLSTLNLLGFMPNNAGEITYSPILLLALFSFIWANDTGAYLVGVTCGKHRLFERISPKKSWEGFFGGALFAIIASLIFAHFVPDIPLYKWIILAIVTVLFATWGDLVESLLKRTIGVKDSGKMIPGHGGILDRLDSAILAAPAMAITFYLLSI